MRKDIIMIIIAVTMIEHRYYCNLIHIVILEKYVSLYCIISDNVMISVHVISMINI